uniref:Uncharacterized protein n=1 Tax=Anguilla anguilla TaxID=7936 RepID=A0A0E9PJD9_ANGAN
MVQTNGFKRQNTELKRHFPLYISLNRIAYIIKYCSSLWGLAHLSTVSWGISIQLSVRHGYKQSQLI